jgi:hypothetical protein
MDPPLSYQTPAALYLGKWKAAARGDVKGGIPEVDRPGDRRSWGILTGNFLVEKAKKEKRSKKERKTKACGN